MICWWCHWGWPKPIADIYLAARAEMDGDESPLTFGPAHIVWEDHNWGWAQDCLDNFEYDHERFCEEDIEIVRRSLIELMRVPDEFKHEAGIRGITRHRHIGKWCMSNLTRSGLYERRRRIALFESGIACRKALRSRQSEDKYPPN